MRINSAEGRKGKNTERERARKGRKRDFTGILITTRGSSASFREKAFFPFPFFSLQDYTRPCICTCMLFKQNVRFPVIPSRREQET